MVAAQGPKRTAMSTPPTAWAVVPSGMGTLNSITRNAKAAQIASRGTSLFLTTLRTFLVAVYQAGSIAAAITASVCGLRYPSGMCTTLLLALAGWQPETPRV